MTLHLGNGSHCPDGLEKIYDEARCTAAVKILDAEVALLRAKVGDPILKTEVDSDWPAGCYLCSNTPGCSRVRMQATNHAQPMQACMTANWPACRMGRI